jgi:hypothetical protein
MREAYSPGQKARPQASGEASPAKREPREDKRAETSFLTPLWIVLSGGIVEPRRPHPREEGVRVAASVNVPALPAVERGRAAPAARDPAPAPAQRMPAERSAPPRPPERVAQASVERRAAAGPLSAIDMETMVAKVVTHYEAGDVDKLLGLYDASSVGLWEAMNLRHDFEEFFRSTRTRRLRLQGVSWDTASPTARVTGAARLVAEYNDTGRVERQVSLVMDIVSRVGQPRIARLSLFPHER